MWEEKDSFGGRRISGAWSQGMLILRRHLNIVRDAMYAIDHTSQDLLDLRVN